MEKKWKISKTNKIFSEKLLEKYHPTILSLLFKRGVTKIEEIEKYFNPDYENDLDDPFKIKDMGKAVERIISAKEKKENIVIFGDYDADGVSSSALLFEVLKNLGFLNISCYIPDRQLEGYGMNMEAVEYLSQKGTNLIITVDCGITSKKEVEKAKELGMDVVVTDHHEIAGEIPEAYACINPNLSESGFSFKGLAGVGVAFKLAQGLYKKISPSEMEQLKWSLDLVALGTVADCVNLIDENRVLAKYGLVVLSKTRRKGFLEIFKVGRIEARDNLPIDSQKVAFQIAPRINAAGRMDHANNAYKLLIEENTAEARVMALELESKNQERQKITKEIFREIKVLAENSFKDKKFIFASSEHWPVGILGLVAGKVADEFQKPTAVFQEKENELVGSFRSIPGVDIMEILRECKDLLIKFGGHAQAAGASISSDKAEEFYEKAEKLISAFLKEKDLVPILKIDDEVTEKEINWELVGQIKKMEPFGEGNKQPVFCARNMIVVDFKIVGNGQKHLKMNLKGKSDSPKIFDAIGFSLAERFPQIKKGDKIDIAFNLEEDEWNGNKKIQLKLIDLKIP